MPGAYDSPVRGSKDPARPRRIVHRHGRRADLLLEQQRDVLPRQGKVDVSDVTQKLLFLTVTVDSTATPGLAQCLGVTGVQSVTVSLFNSCFQNYFWNYDHNGPKVLQLRFYANS